MTQNGGAWDGAFLLDMYIDFSPFRQYTTFLEWQITISYLVDLINESAHNQIFSTKQSCMHFSLQNTHKGYANEAMNILEAWFMFNFYGWYYPEDSLLNDSLFVEKEQKFTLTNNSLVLLPIQRTLLSEFLVVVLAYSSNNIICY